jgi:hypothetical protein
VLCESCQNDFARHVSSKIKRSWPVQNRVRLVKMGPNCRRDRRVSWNVILSPVLNLFLMSLLIWLNSVVQVLVGSWFSIASFWWRRWGPWGLWGLYWIPYFHLVHRRLEYSRPKKMVKNLHLDWGEYGYRLPRAETLACRTATRRRPQTNSLN